MELARGQLLLLLKVLILAVVWLPSEQTSLVETFKVECPCSDSLWCEPIRDTTRKEVFAFSTSNDPSHWTLYDWSKVTTVVMFGYVNQSLMCLAHSHGARAVFLGSVNNETFLSPELRTKWIAKQLDVAKSNFLDGINFDYEGIIEENDQESRDGYTALVKETNEAFKKELPYFQVSVDVAWKPNVDLRFYDYVGLAENSDFLFVMAYDEQSQIFGKCLALPNSGMFKTSEGLQVYVREKSIPPNKMVLGLPWYGYYYPCINKQGDECEIEEVPFRGVNCSDAAGKQVAYGTLYKTELTSTTKWNDSSWTPFYDCVTVSGQPCQVHYDNPRSLALKYKMAKDMDLRGVGMWNIDELDYSDTIAARNMRKLMFSALPGRDQQTPSRRLVPKSGERLSNFDPRAAR